MYQQSASASAERASKNRHNTAFEAKEKQKK